MKSYENAYDWMVRYTPQKEWIHRKGILIWLALYAGILGGGAYLASLFYNSLKGMIVSWIIVAIIKSGLHVFHAERPMKLWRMILHPRTSWISRGLLFTVLLIVFGAIQIVLTSLFPGSGAETALKILTGITAFCVLAYAGLTLNYINGIPFWNSALLPVIFILWGILSGQAFIMALGSHSLSGISLISHIFLLISTGLVIILYLMTASYAEPTAKQSVKYLTKGRLAFLLWFGVFIIGIVIPLAIVLQSHMGGSLPAESLAIFMLACEIAGGLSLTYAVMKVGYYSPLVQGQA
jgi:formate-dependent nitrite reductase membrane component NrfD